MKNKTLAVLSASLLCASASAGTYTWTGAAGDNLYFTAGNWSYDDGAGNVTSPAATAPARNTTDDIVIATGDAVNYVPGGDWEPKGSTTISNGSSLTQTGGNSWPRIQGPLLLDGGSYDTGSAGQFRLGATMTVRNGGSFATPKDQANYNSAGRLVVEQDGVVEIGTTSTSREWTGAIPVSLSGGTMTVHGVFTSNAGDLYEGGELVMTGEFHPLNGLAVDGTVITCTVYSPQGADRVVSFASGGLVCTSTGFDGFYQNAGVYIDVPAGSTATFTMPVAAANVYAAYFANGKFRYDGATISADDFADLFTVEEVDAAHARFKLSNAAPAYAFGAPSASNVTVSSGTVSATLRKVGEGVGTVVVAYATSAAAIDLANGESLGAAGPEGTVYSKTISGLAAEVEIFYAFGVLGGGEVVAQTAVASFEPSAYTAKFLGTVSTAANVAANWRDNVVPTSSDTILIAADCDWGTMAGSANLSLQNWNVTVEGAALRLNGEVNRTGAATIRNGSLSASVFVGSGTPIEVRGSDMVSTTTRGDITRGFYSNGPFFNFHSGDACSYTYHYNGETAPAEADEFNALFAQGRILVDGAVLTDGSRVSISVDTENSTVTATLLESVVEASFEGASTAAVNGLSATLSAAVEVGGGRPLYVLTGSDPANLTATLVAAEAADNTTYTYVATGAEGTAVYWQFRLGEAADGLLDTTVPQSFFAMASGNLWTGALSGLASVPDNWSKGHVPTAAEPVYVVAEFAHNDLVWDVANATVGSWKQLGDAVVYLNGATNNVLTIAGDAELSGGYWTHSGPADEPSTILNVAVGGDLTVAAGAAIQTGTGTPNDIAQRSRGYTRAHGPGYVREAGGSFAGEGGHIPAADFSGVSTYGSILDPLSYGSGGWGDNANYAGGGVIKLAVAGALTVNGTICSRGFGYPQANENYIGGAGSGGSINIVAASLSGTGSIDANGGSNGLYGPGGGGRVKVALTGAGEDFTGFSGTIEALGGSFQNNTQATTYDITPAAAGTVCLSTAADTEPTVRVHNVWRYGNAEAEWRVATDPDAVPSATHLPAMQDADSPAALRGTRWELSGHGALRLTADARLLSLSLAATNGSQRVYTDGHVLTVKELAVAGAAKRAGRYTAADLPNVIVGTGAIVVDVMPIVIMVR